MKNRNAIAVLIGTGVLAGAAATAAPAAADTPAPTPSNGPAQLQNTPLKNSGVTLTKTKQTSTSKSISLGWKTQRNTVTLQTSQQSPIKDTSGRWSFGNTYVQPAVVKGKTNGPKQPSKSNGKHTYQFNQKLEGLNPGTVYYTLVNVPLAPGYKPVQLVFKTRTKVAPNLPLAAPKTRKVRATVEKVKVISDGDSGIRGKGEVRFGIRLAPDANPLIASNWGDWSHRWDDYGKVSGGDTYTFAKPLSHTITTMNNKAFVQLQGYENDIDPGNYCAIEGGPHTASQGSDECFDTAVAEGSLTLSTKKSGKTTQWVTVKVYRATHFTFEATVKVESWFI